MKARGQFLVALVVAAAVVAAAVYLDGEVGARPLGSEPGPGVPTGAWFCPHGGGSKDWDVRIQLANPGPDPVRVRVRTISSEKPSTPHDDVVEPGSTLVVPVPGRAREASTTVEYFGGFVAAGWIEHAGGDETGVAAEPCLADTGVRWLLPDGTAAVEENDDHVVVMNPHATEAVISLTLLTDGQRGPVRTEDWTNVTLRPYRSRAFSLNENALGDTTVSTIVDVSVGRGRDARDLHGWRHPRERRAAGRRPDPDPPGCRRHRTDGARGREHRIPARGADRDHPRGRDDAARGRTRRRRAGR
jgi:hypothetical protein